MMMTRFKTMVTILTISLVGIIAQLTVLQEDAQAIHRPSLKGGWRLVSRTLADSTVVPDSLISGTIIFSDSTKHMTMNWKNDEGKWVTITHIASYEFDHKNYSEENIYYMKVISSRKATAEINSSDTSAVSNVEKRDHGYWFAFPLFDGPSVFFPTPRLMTTFEMGVYKDQWELML